MQLGSTIPTGPQNQITAKAEAKMIRLFFILFKSVSEVLNCWLADSCLIPLRLMHCFLNIERKLTGGRVVWILVVHLLHGIIVCWWFKRVVFGCQFIEMLEKSEIFVETKCLLTLTLPYQNLFFNIVLLRNSLQLFSHFIKVRLNLSCFFVHIILPLKWLPPRIKTW